MTYAGLRHAFGVMAAYEPLNSSVVGFTPYYAKMYLLCLFTTTFTDLYTNARKKEAGLKEW